VRRARRTDRERRARGRPRPTATLGDYRRILIREVRSAGTCPLRSPDMVTSFQMGNVRTSPRSEDPKSPICRPQGSARHQPQPGLQVHHPAQPRGDRRLNRALHMASAPACAWTPRPAPRSSSASPMPHPQRSATLASPYRPGRSGPVASSSDPSSIGLRPRTQTSISAGSRPGSHHS
jgi:hypothetical protein